MNSTVAQYEQLTGLTPAAAQRGLDLVYPVGLDGSWNAGSCCGRAAQNGYDDLGYLDQVLASALRESHADPRDVVLLGFSNGAMLAYWYACTRPDAVRAIGLVAAAVTAPCSPGPVFARHLHGTDDTVIPYAGGFSPALQMDFPPVQTEPDRVAAQAPGSQVTIETMQGVHHAWPGFATATCSTRSSRRHARPARPVDPRTGGTPMTQRITPFLWFDTQAEEAAASTSRSSRTPRILGVARYPEGSRASRAP